MIYSSNEIRVKLQEEKAENSLISKELLNMTLRWIEQFNTYPSNISFDLDGSSADFLPFLDGNKTTIEQAVIAAKNRKRRYGPAPKPAAELRNNLIGIYLTDNELSDIATRAGTRIPLNQKGGDSPARRKIADFIRRSVSGSLPPTVPHLNHTAWSELAHVLSNLNQIAHKLNSGMPINDIDSQNIAEIKSTVTALRPKLLGRKL